MKTIGAVIDVPSMRPEIAAKPSRMGASVASCQCTRGASQRRRRPGLGWRDAGVGRGDGDRRGARRALLAEQFPELDAAGPPARRGLGQLRLGRRGAVGVPFPRRAVAIPGVERELEMLPRLAPLLPVPFPSRGSSDAERRFPWPFFGAPLLPASSPPTRSSRRTSAWRWAQSSGASCDLACAGDACSKSTGRALPVDLIRRADMAKRVPWRRDSAPGSSEDLAARRRAGLLAERRVSPRRASCVSRTATSTSDTCSSTAALAGVIDWVDVCRADPSIDLQLVLVAAPAAGRERSSPSTDRSATSSPPSSRAGVGCARCSPLRAHGG